MKKIKAVMIRIEEKKHRALRHELLDRGISFSAFVNKLIDERSLKRPGGAIKVEQQAKKSYLGFYYRKEPVSVRR